MKCERAREREECISEVENPAMMNDLANAMSRSAFGSIQEFGLSSENRAINVTSRDQSQGACGCHACSLYPHSYPIFSGSEMECAGEKVWKAQGERDSTQAERK